MNKKAQINFIPVIIITLGLMVGGVIVYEQYATNEFNENDVSVTFCADGQEIIYNSALTVSWKDGENSTDSKLGGFEETIKTYESHPECVNPEWIKWHNQGGITKEPLYEVNMECLTKQCNKIVKLNQLNGTVTEIWKKGEIW